MGLLRICLFLCPFCVCVVFPVFLHVSSVHCSVHFWKLDKEKLWYQCYCVLHCIMNIYCSILKYMYDSGKYSFVYVIHYIGKIIYIVFCIRRIVSLMCKDWNVRCINICNLWKLMCKYKKGQDKGIVVDWNVLCEHILHGHIGLSVQVVVSTWKYMGQVRWVAFVFRVLSISLLRRDIRLSLWAHIIQSTSKWKLGMRMCNLRLCFIKRQNGTISVLSIVWWYMNMRKKQQVQEYKHMCVYLFICEF